MSNKRRGLGRGLDSLLGDAEMVTPEGSLGAVADASLPVEALQPNPNQPRSRFDETELASLAESIRQRGLVQPIVVASGADGHRIVAGERRWRAAQMAGLERVPVVRREAVGEQEMLELALIENLHRADLNPVDEASAYAALRDHHGLSQEKIGRAVGKSRAAIANSLRLLELPGRVRNWLRDGALTAGQARPLLALGDQEAIIALAERAQREGLSARQVEALVKSPARSRKAKPRAKEVHTVAAEEQLTRALQTKVEIQRRGSRGTIRLHFASEEELMRLFEVLTRT